VSENEIRDLLRSVYPRIRPAGNGWVLETAPDILVPVPDPDYKLAYIAHRARWTDKQYQLIQIALQKRIPLPADPATIFYLEQLFQVAG